MCVSVYCALWLPSGKGLTSWLPFVVYNCEVRYSTWLYRFLIFAPLLTWMKNLEVAKAKGPDGIPAYIFKTEADELAPALALLFQLSMDQGKILQDWKQALVVPIFKKGDKHQPSNYRPVLGFLSPRSHASCLNILFTTILCIILTSTESYVTTNMDSGRNPLAIPNCCWQYNSQGISSGHHSAWLCKSFRQSPHNSQTGPLWSERKCEMMYRVLPRPQRTASDPWWSQVRIHWSPLLGTTGDCPGTPVVPVFHQWPARIYKVFSSQAVCRWQSSIQGRQERQWQRSSPKRPFSTRALGENLADEFQPHQMCSVEDFDKEDGTSHPVRAARSHSRSGRLQQIPWSYYQGWPVMGNSNSKHSEQGKQNSWFSTKKHEGLDKASERPHIQGYDSSNYGVCLNCLGPSPTNSYYSNGAGAEMSGSLCL